MTIGMFEGVFLGFMAVLALYDLRLRQLPNPLVGAGAVAWLVLRLAGLGPPWGSALAAAAAAGLAFAALFALLPGAVGGGDVKLVAVMGLYLGWPQVFGAVLVALIAAALVAGAGLALGRLRREDDLPLAPFLAVGAAWMLLVWPG